MPPRAQELKQRARVQPERFVVGPAADDFYGAHASDDYGAIGGALGAAARRQFAAVEGLKSKAGEEVSVARMRQRLDESAASSAAKTLLARHMSMFEVVAERVKRRGLLEVGASEQVRHYTRPARSQPASSSARA